MSVLGGDLFRELDSPRNPPILLTALTILVFLRFCHASVPTVSAIVFLEGVGVAAFMSELVLR